MMESSNVDDRTQHEIYVAPFLRSVMAGVTSVMCSYNLVNGTYACENDHTINDILKNELGFQGFVMSDWTAQHSTISAMAGLDMSMPGNILPSSSFALYFGANLTAYVQNNTIPEARLDDMVTRILASWYFLGQDSPDYPKTNFNEFFPLDEETNEHIDVQDDHGKLVREIGTSSIVLLKNVDGALPLKKPRKLVLIGSDGGPARIAGPNEFPSQGGVDGVLAVGWGSGYVHCSLRMRTVIHVSHRSHWDVGSHCSPTKSRYVFRFVIGKRGLCFIYHMDHAAI
jgi:beta-glucosidase-like glycosyl hydrolase